MESKVGFIIGRQTLDVRRWTIGYKLLTSNVQRLKSNFNGAPRLRRARDHAQARQQ